MKKDKYQRLESLQKGYIKDKDVDKVLPNRTEKQYKVVRIDSKTVKYVQL